MTSLKYIMETLLQLILSIFIIVLAARWLTHTSEKIIKLSGMAPLFFGSIFLAASTSAPEFFVDIRATLHGYPEMAAGNLLGACLMNLVVFSLAVLIFRKQISPRTFTHLLYPGLLGLILVFEAGLLIYFKLPYRELFGLEWGSYLLLFTYFAGIRILFKKNTPPVSSIQPPIRKPRILLRAIFNFFLATLILFFTSPFLVSAASKIAQTTGLENSFIGMTLLAITTTLPEMGITFVAARKGHFDLVIGNIFGSVAFNMAIFVFMDWIWQGSSLWTTLPTNLTLASGAVILNIFLVLITWGNPRIQSPMLKLAGGMAVLLISLACYSLFFSF